MTHNKSTFIWETFKLLKYAQFPWRFLALSVFTASLAGGSAVYMLKGRVQIAIAILISILTVVLNVSYFKPENFFLNLTDRDKISGELWENQQRGGILDYLPISAVEPKEKAPEQPITRQGSADITQFTKGTNYWRLRINVYDDALVELPIFEYPNWTVSEGNRQIAHIPGVIGRITFELPVGEHNVVGKLVDTPVRTIANVTTLVSFISLVGLVTYGKSRKLFS